MATIPLAVVPDRDDDYALQAWVDANADEVPCTLLLDTGTHRSALPHVEPFASRTRRVTAGGRGVFGVPAEETMVQVDSLQTGDLHTQNLVVELQPLGWRHPALLGMDVLGSHRCTFVFDDHPRIDVDGPEPDAAWSPLTTDSHRTPTVEIQWDQTTSAAIWDTGAGITLVDLS